GKIGRPIFPEVRWRNATVQGDLGQDIGATTRYGKDEAVRHHAIDPLAVVSGFTPRSSVSPYVEALLAFRDQSKWFGGE
ncbi:MAG: hypothetical protein M0Z36_01300, partial [Thermaerobacter sp.]|nr:hypothetical protein [Thermaerobacter sp.]